jgi:hypothetical protein
MYSSLIKEHQQAQAKVNDLYRKLSETSDGFLYITKTRCYGSIHWNDYPNEYLVQELCDEYYGDNGIIDVYTNNPNHSIQTYGDVEVMSLEQLQELTKESVSMTQALCNWVAKN